MILYASVRSVIAVSGRLLLGILLVLKKRRKAWLLLLALVTVVVLRCKDLLMLG